MYGNLGSCFPVHWATIKNPWSTHEKQLKIAIQIGDRDGEGGAYGNLGNAYQSMGDYRKAIEYYEKLLKIATEIGDKARRRKRLSKHWNGVFFFLEDNSKTRWIIFVSAVDILQFFEISA